MISKNRLCRLLLVLSSLFLLVSCSGDQGGAQPGRKTAGKVLESDQQISTGLYDEEQPAVAYDTANHKYLTVWTDLRNGSTDIYGRLASGKSLFDDGSYNPATKTGGALLYDNYSSVQPNKRDGWPKIGTPPLTLEREIRITDSAALASDQRQPKVAFYPNPSDPGASMYLVIWTDLRNGYSQIYGQFLRADGAYLTSAGAVSATAANFPITERVDSLFGGTVSVTGSFSAPLSNGTVSINTIDPTRVIGAGTTFNDMEVNDVIIISGVSYAVAGIVSDTELILSSPYTGFPIVNLQPRPVSGLSYLSYGADTASNVVDGVGTNFVAEGIRAGDMISIGDVYYEVASVESATRLYLTTPATQSFTGSGLSYRSTAHLNQSDPDIIYNAVKKRFVVVWRDISDLDTNNTMELRGGKCGNSVLVNYIPLPMVDNNVVKMVYINPDFTSQEPLISAKERVSTLVATSPLSDNGSEMSKSWSVHTRESRPKVTYDPNTGDNYLAWSGINESVTFKMTYRKNPDPSTTCIYDPAVFTATAEQTAPKVQLRWDSGLGLVQDLTMGTDAGSPSLTVDPVTNRLLVVWEENGNAGETGKDILGQLVALGGFTRYGNQINVATAVGDQTTPVTSFDGVNQRYLVVWEDARNESANISNIDIYGQFVDQQGNLSGGNTIITVAPSNQLAPAVVFGDTFFRKFLVVWKDGRLNNNANITGQLMEYSTLPQLVIADAEGLPILNGAIHFGNVDIASATPYKEIPFKIRNDGNMPLTISSITTPYEGDENPLFFLTTPKPVTISPGTSVDMSLRFAPTAAGSYAGEDYKMVFNSNGGEAVIYLSGAGVGEKPLSIATSTLPGAIANSALNEREFRLVAAGGEIPYTTWTITSGRPTWLNIKKLDEQSAVLTGTVPADGQPSYRFTVSVTDSAGAVATKEFTLNVSTLTVAPTTLKPWTIGAPGYSEQLTATLGGDEVNATWSVIAAPQGLNVSAAGVVTSGATGPLVPGTNNLTVRATYTDSENRTYTATQTVSLIVNLEPEITTISLPSVVMGSDYLQTLAVREGTPSYTWSLKDGKLPTGLSLSSDGRISGRPGGTGGDFTVTVTDGTGASTDKVFTIGGPLAILPIELPDVTTGSTYFKQLNAEGGASPYTWSIAGGSLPAGVTLNGSTGILSGTLTGDGPSDFVVQVTDKNGTTVLKNLKQTVLSDTVTSTNIIYTGENDEVSRSSLDLGTRMVGTTTPATLLLRNKGEAAITIRSITSSSSAFPVNVQLNRTLQPGDYVPVSIMFTPTTPGSIGAIVEITDSNGTSYPLTVSGTGVTATAVLASGGSATTTLDYYPLPVNSPLFLNGDGKPAGFVVGNALGLSLENVPAGGTVRVAVTLQSVADNQRYFKVVNNKWTELFPVGERVGNTVTLEITDNNPLHDYDVRDGFIQDPIVVGSVGSSGTGNGGNGTNPPPSSEGGKSGGCFIATAAYGSYLDPHVVVLRNFRDQVLLKSEAGSAFVKFYYTYSPPIAEFIYRHDTLRLITRWALTPLIVAVKFPLLLLVLPLGALGYARRRVEPLKPIATPAFSSKGRE